jgi:hypothetical protein
MIVGLLIVGVVLLLGAIFATLIGQLFRRPAARDCSLEWLDEFSLESYRPMERLLNEGDFEFLASQPGYHSGIARELRAERRKIFRVYLHSLIRDFNRLMRLAELMMVYSEQDRPDLARTIFGLRRQFYMNVVAIEIRLALSPLPAGVIEVKHLIRSLAAMQENVEQLAVHRTSF